MDNISRKWNIVLIFIFVVFFIGFASSQVLKSNKLVEDSKLAFQIETSQDTVRIGNSILIYMYLKNTANDSIRVKTRMAANREDEPHDVFFKVHDPSGQQLSFLVDIQFPSILSDDDYEILPPDQWIVKLCQIEHFFDFHQKGFYKIQAVYQNWTSPEAGDAWQGSLESNILEIQIQE